MNLEQIYGIELEICIVIIVSVFLSVWSNVGWLFHSAATHNCLWSVWSAGAGWLVVNSNEKINRFIKK